MNSVLFSMIVPIYNEGEKLRNTLESFVKVNGIESYMEVILVDDGSTDVSSDICDEYAERFSFVKVIHKENGGCVLARKSGVEFAHGEYIVFSDGDDLVENTYLEDLRYAIECKADYYILNNKIGKNGFVECYQEKNFLKTGYAEKNEVYKWIFAGYAGAVWDKIYVASLMKKCFVNIDTKLIYGDDVLINSYYLEFVETIYVYDSSSYIHIMDSNTSVCNTNVKLSRLDEIDLLYKEVSVIFNRLHMNVNVRQLFNEVLISNFLKNIVLIINSGTPAGLVKDSLSQYEVFNLNNTIKCKGKTSKAYAFLLKHKLFFLSSIICKLRAIKYH